jgi:hypothetical protein
MKAKKLRVVVRPFQHFLGILVLLPTNRIAVIAGRGDHHHQRLPARPGRCLHHVPQIPVGLRMQLVK